MPVVRWSSKLGGRIQERFRPRTRPEQAVVARVEVTVAKPGQSHLKH